MATRLWRLSQLSAVRHKTSVGYHRCLRSWSASSARVSVFHPSALASRVVSSRAFGVSESEAEMQAVEIEAPTLGTNSNKHDHPAGYKMPPSDDYLMSLVEEILAFQDEIGNTKVRLRWTREYGFLQRQLGLLGHRSNDADDEEDFGESDGDHSMLSAIEHSRNDDDDGQQSVHLSHLEKSPGNQLGENLISMEPHTTAEKPNLIAGDLAKGTAYALDQPLDDTLASIDKDELASKNSNELASEGSNSLSDNLVEKHEPDDALQQRSSKHSLAQALALLRSMRRAEWRAYDQTEGNMSDDDTDSEDETDQDDDSVEEFTEGDVGRNSTEIDDSLCVQDPDHTNVLAPKASRRSNLVERENDVMLPTDESNKLLVRLALSSDLEAEEILRRMMEEYQRMTRLDKLRFEAFAPNQTTHEILLLTLYQRLGAVGTAVDVISQMIQNEEQWTPDTLLATTKILERRRSLEMSMQLLTSSFKDTTRENKIPKRVYRSTLKLAKQNDAKDVALDVLEMCMKETVRRHDRIVDKIVIDTIDWPTRNRRGQKIDTTDFLRDLADQIEKRRMYIPGTIVWKHLVVAASNGALENGERCELVRRAFQKFLASCAGDARKWLTRNIFHQGIVVGEALGDAELVANVTTRFLQQEIRHPSKTTEDKIAQSLPIKDITQAMELCIRHGDNLGARSILDLVTPLLNSNLIPKQIVESLYLLCLKGYAAKGEPASARDLLNEMKLKSLYASEEAYGTVIHSYAIAGHHAEAKDFFTLTETRDGMVPGATCYDGLILSCVRSRSWQEAMTVFEDAKAKKLSLHASTAHAVIMSASRLGGSASTTTNTDITSVIQDILEMKIDLNRETCVLAMRVLIPELGIKSGATTLDDIRQRLRNMVGTTKTLNQERALELVSRLKMAELEDERRGLKEGVASPGRPHKAWASALASLIACTDSNETGMMQC